MEYKVLKDLPGIKSNTILIKNNGGYFFCYSEESDTYQYKYGIIQYDEEYLKAYPDFFEPINKTHDTD